MSEEHADLVELPAQMETLSELLRIGKDEMNIAEFPMTSLSDRQVSGETSLKFEDQIWDDRKKKLISRKRLIEGSKEYGLPTATDDSVILALIQLTKLKNGFTNREVEFSRYELITLLNWPNKGQSYDRIAQSLHRVASVTYHFENSWWDNRRKAWTTKIFGIIDTVELNDSRGSDEQGILFTSRIIWNQVILDSFQAGYLRSLDFNLAISLKHAISMRIYRFMGKRFHLRREWMFEIKDFAYEHIGISRNYEGGTQIARKLKPALAELEEVGFLEKLSDAERFPKKGRVWSIRLLRRAEQDAQPPAGEPLDDPRPLLASELAKRGVSDKTAAELVAAHRAEVIQAKLEVFDWMVGRQDKRIGKSPEGYLVESIREDYKAPRGFVSAAQWRQEEAARTAREQQAVEDRRRKLEDDAQVEADRKAADTYLRTLSEAERSQLEAKALAAASEEARANYQDAVMARYRDTLMLGMVRDYLRPILRTQPPVEA